MNQEVDLSPQVEVTNDSNVTFIDGQSTVSPEISPSGVPLRVETIEGSEIGVSKELMGRWTQIDTFKFDSSVSRGDFVKSYSFPSALISGGYAQHANAYAIIRNYLYMRTDVELRFVVNANKFQVGQLQVSAYYAPELDSYYSSRGNVYSRSQMMHQLISIHNNKPVEFYIPFAYPKQFLRTRDIKDFPNNDFAEVSIFCLNSLRQTSGTYNSCTISVYARLQNVTLNGMIPNQIALPAGQGPQPDPPVSAQHEGGNADHEMFTAAMAAVSAIDAAVRVGERAVKLVKGVNRDYPRDARPDSVIIPRQTSSWSIGKNLVSPANVLRLDTKGNTPTAGRDEMKVSNVAQTYGLLSQEYWNSSHVIDHQVYYTDVTPLGISLPIIEKAATNELTLYQPTPVGAVASMFSYWRGSLKFRFDFIASFMHTGRLVATFMPYLATKETPTKDERVNITQVIFDLQEAQSFTFEVPFVWDKEWCTVHSPRRKNSDPFPRGIGRLDVQVLNPLIPNDSISPTIEFNVYVAGGADFEVCIPVNPEIALGWDREYRVIPHNKVAPTSDTAQLGVGSDVTSKALTIVLKEYDPETHSGKLATFDNIQPDIVYAFESKAAFKDSSDTEYAYFVKCREAGFSNNARVFSSLDEAKTYIGSGSTLIREPTFPMSLVTVTKDNNGMDVQFTKPTKAQHEGPEDEVVVNPLNTYSPLSQSAFGESFMDFKDIIRRFQYYADFTTTLQPEMPYGSTIARVPLTFSGLTLNLFEGDRVNETANRMRDGIIPVIASAYRFFTGSMRARIICSCTDPEAFVQIMHVPELLTDSHAIQRPDYRHNKDYISTGYAGFGQAIRMNQVLDLEIPYYLPGARGTLQRSDYYKPDDSTIFNALGCLEISTLVPLKKAEEIDIRIFFAAADDTEFTHFTGFPPMVLPKEIPLREPPAYVHPAFDKVKGTPKAVPSVQVVAQPNKLLRDDLLEVKESKFPAEAYIDRVDYKFKEIGENQVQITIGKMAPLMFYLQHDGHWITNYHSTKSSMTEDRRQKYEGYGIKITDVGESTVMTVKDNFDARRFGQKAMDVVRQQVEWDITNFLGYLYTAITVKAIHQDATLVPPTLKPWDQVVHEDFSDAREMILDEKLRHVEFAKRTDEFRTFNISEIGQIFDALGYNFSKVEHEAWYDVFGIQNFFNSCSEVPLATADMIDNFSRIAGEFINNMGDSFAKAAATARTVLGHLTHLIVNPCAATIAVSFVFILDSLSLRLFESGMATTLISIFTGILAGKIIYRSIEGLANLTIGAKDLAKARAQPNTYEHSDTSKCSHEAGEYSEILAVMVSLACLILGIKSQNVRVPGNLFSNFIKSLPRVSVTHVTTLNFLRSIFECLGTLINWIRTTIFPTNRFLKDLFSNESEIETWAEDSMNLVNPLYESRILGSPRLINHTFECYRKGLVYKKAIIENKLTGSGVTVIKELCKELQNVTDGLLRKGLMQNIKFEPFVLHITGPPGIGKSRLVTELVDDMLTEIGMTPPNPIFTKTTGVEYWNGLGMQPVVLFDDFLAYGGTDNKEALELFQLKSCAGFNPPKAKIEEKENWYSPLLVVLVSNAAYPKSDKIACESAFWRRRDLLVKVGLDNTWTEKYPKKEPSDIVQLMNPKHFKDYKHLKFRRYISTIVEGNNTCSFNVRGKTGTTYPIFRDYVLKKFGDYYSTEIKSFINKAKERLDKLDIDEGLTMKQLTDEINSPVASKFFSLADQGLQILRNTVGLDQTNDPTGIIHNSGEDDNWGDSDDERGLSVEQLRAEPEETEDDLRHACKGIVDKVFDAFRPEVTTEQYEQEMGEEVYQDARMDTDTDWRYDDETGFYCRAEEDLQPLRKRREELAKILTFVRENTIPCIHRIIGLPNVTYERDVGSPSGYFSVFNFHKPLPNVSEMPCDHEQCIMKSPDKARIYLTPYMERLIHGLEFAHSDIPRCFHPEKKIPKFDKNWIKSISDLKEIKTYQELWQTVKQTDAYKFFSDFSNVAIVITSFVGVLGAIWGAARAVSRMTASAAEINEHEYGSGDSRVRGSRKKKKNSKLIMDAYKKMNNFSQANHESCSNDTLDAIGTLVARNMFQLYYKGKRNSYINALGTHGQTALTLKHFYEKWCDEGCPPIALSGYRFGPTSTANSKVIQLTKSDWIIDPNSSLCYVTFGNDVPAFLDIRKHVASADDHDNATSDCMFYELRPDFSIRTTPLRAQFNPGRVEIDADGAATEQILLANSYAYNKHGKGLCGSILVTTNTQPKIIGMHCCGGKTVGSLGYSQPVLREALDAFDVVVVSEYPASCNAEGGCDLDPTMCEYKPLIKPECTIMPLGTLNKDLCPHLPEKSKIIPLPTQGVFHEVLEDIAVLSPKDPRMIDAGLNFSPLQEGIIKHGRPPVGFNEQKLKKAGRDILNKLKCTTQPVFSSHKDLLTEEQIVCGIDGEQGYKSMDMSTSEGYPLVLQRPKNCSSKRWLFDIEEEDGKRKLNHLNEPLKQLREENFKKRKSGIAPCTIFMDALKDYHMKKQKVLKPGSTRIFSASPVEYTMAIKEYFGHFQGALIQNRVKNEVCVGINCDGPEWRDVVVYLSQVAEGKPPKIVTGDYSHFGDSLDSGCLAQAFEIMIGWYDHFFPSNNNNDHHEVREVLRDEFMHVQHLAGNLLYRMFCGQPSGFALTVELNSLVNMLYMRLAWMDIMRTYPEYAGLDQFNRYVRLLTYGDDLIMSVSPVVIHLYNFNTIRNFLAVHQISFTHSSKDPTYCQPYESLEDSTFLKRGFRNHPTRSGQYLAPLPDASIYSQLDWGWKTENVDTLVMNNMRAALGSAYTRGEKFFDDLYDKLYDYWSSHYPGEHVRLPQWSTIDDLRFKNVN